VIRNICLSYKRSPLRLMRKQWWKPGLGRRGRGASSWMKEQSRIFLTRLPRPPSAQSCHQSLSGPFAPLPPHTPVFPLSSWCGLCRASGMGWASASSSCSSSTAQRWILQSYFQSSSQLCVL
jgi:hypothetical protein